MLEALVLAVAVVVVVVVARGRRRRTLRLEPQLMVQREAAGLSAPRRLPGRPTLRMPPPVRHPLEEPGAGRSL